MIEENKFILRDVRKVLSANSSTITVINLRVSKGKSELEESIISDDKSNLLITKEECITLADILGDVKKDILNTENVLIVNATNQAGFSQIEYCLINGMQLDKKSAADLVLASDIGIYNSDGYFGNDVL